MMMILFIMLLYEGDCDVDEEGEVDVDGAKKKEKERPFLSATILKMWFLGCLFVVICWFSIDLSISDNPKNGGFKGVLLWCSAGFPWTFLSATILKVWLK